MNIYGRDGEPISLEEFAAVPRKKRIVKRSTFILRREPVTVLTEWDGRDMSHGDAPVPCPFSTLVYSKSFPDMLMATTDEDKARMSHEMMCGFVRAHGAKSGWRMPAYYLSHVWATPRSVGLGIFNVVLSALVLLVQLIPLTLSVITWDWGWGDAVTAPIAVLWGWLLANSLRGLKGKLQERREERRTAADKAEFEKIVGQIE